MNEHEMGGQDATIPGTVEGGPLDGCTFALPAIAGVSGTVLSVNVNGEWHVYALVPGQSANTLAHRGTEPGPWRPLPDPK